MTTATRQAASDPSKVRPSSARSPAASRPRSRRPRSPQKAKEAVQGPANGSGSQSAKLNTDLRSEAAKGDKPKSTPPAAPLTAETKKTMSDLARALKLTRDEALEKTKAISGKEWADLNDADGRAVCAAFEAEFQKTLAAEGGA